MPYSDYLMVRVSSQMKARVHALAEQQLISEAMWLRQVVAAALREAGLDETAANRPVPARLASDATRGRESRRTAYTAIRLRREDWRLLRERAQARSMGSCTYVSVLVRSHLLRVTPLPKDELIALKHSVAELGAIGRNLNHLARAVNGGDRVVGLAREDLWALLEVCKAVRAEVKELIRTNVSSWEVGYAEPKSERA